jgi:hypothetical protein
MGRGGRTSLRIGAEGWWEDMAAIGLLTMATTDLTWGGCGCRGQIMASQPRPCEGVFGAVEFRKDSPGKRPDRFWCVSVVARELMNDMINNRYCSSTGRDDYGKVIRNTHRDLHDIHGLWRSPSNTERAGSKYLEVQGATIKGRDLAGDGGKIGDSLRFARFP